MYFNLILFFFNVFDSYLDFWIVIYDSAQFRRQPLYFPGQVAAL